MVELWYTARLLVSTRGEKKQKNVNCTFTPVHELADEHCVLEVFLVAVGEVSGVSKRGFHKNS